MEVTQSPGLTETLANLSVAWILAICAGLTVVRLGLIRIPHSGARSFAEILESAIIAIVLVFLVIRPFVLQAYFIPSPSMEPTLLGKDNVGDRILVNKFLYRFHKPHDDDVVVFLAPPAAMEGNPDFIKRLIGSSGDVIVTTRGRVLVNGQEYDHEAVRDALGHSGVFGQDAEASASVDQADHHVKFVNNGVMADGQLITMSQLGQDLAQNPQADVTVIPGVTLRNGKPQDEPFIAEDPDYDLQIYNGESLKHSYDSGMMRDFYKLNGDDITKSDYERFKASPPESVPTHKLLMMGDNRNDSRDSTEWGLLDDNRVVGRAVFIFWPLTRMHPIR